MGSILLLTSVLLFMSGCQFFDANEPTEIVSAYERNMEVISSDKERIIGEIHEDIFEPGIAEKENTEENFLHIPHKADLPYQLSTGRYSISGIGTGYIYLYDHHDNLVYREYMAYGIEAIEVDIKDTYEFRFSGLEEVFITEIEPEIRNELTTGIWEVGIHIVEGTYEVTGEGIGYIKVLSGTSEVQLFESIGSPYTHSKSIIDFHIGQKVIISGLSKVSLQLVN